MMFQIRALVFTRLIDEAEEDMLLNSATLMGSHDYATGWGNMEGLTWAGRALVKLGVANPILKRRVVTSA